MTAEAAAAGERLTHWEGEPVTVWEALWRVPSFEAWSTLGSTNDRLRELADDGAGRLTTVLAEEQTAGRGRGGRRWASPAGLGVWMSVLLRIPGEPARRLAPLVMGVAACRAVERAVPGLDARLKWPNDVLVGERKVAGVLCEGLGGEAVVAGVGLNVAQREADFALDLDGTAASLEMLAGRPVLRAAVVGALLGEVRALLESPPPRLSGALAAELGRRDVLRDAPVALEDGVRGVARGIDPSGRLVVEVGPGDVRPLVAGSVRRLAGGTAGGDPGAAARRRT